MWFIKVTLSCIIICMCLFKETSQCLDMYGIDKRQGYTHTCAHTHTLLMCLTVDSRGW